MINSEEYLKELPFWNNLSDSERKQLCASAVIKSYDKGQEIHGSGNDCLGMIYIISGEIRIYILSEEGREITLFRLENGEVCVLSASCVLSQLTFETQICAEKKTELLIVNSSVLSSLAEKNIYVRCYMYELIAERFSSVMWIMQQILFLGFDRRLANFLVRECAKNGRNEINMTHEQIAKDLGSAREVVARMLKRFSAEGLVEIRRGSIIVKDIDALESLAELVKIHE